ncbi:MAG: hypothetical protein EPO20_09530 [Betaproteobacteria bacterium]|nr:MAG: hypothetical protein EPO20_09530 [Betaproteobacteria bacterium]
MKDRRDFVAWTGLAMYCVFLSWFNWAVMPPELAFSGDVARWLAEAYRVSLGEAPYRDFSWQFPPLAAYFYGWAFSAFGATYGTASLLGAILSTADVLLTYAVARRFLDRPLAVAAVVLFATAGGFNFKNFALFGLRIYSPAMLLGYGGVLALVLGLDGFVRARAWSLRDVLLVVLGTFICLSAKPEFAISAVVGLGIAFALDIAATPSRERSRVAVRSLIVATAFVAPAIAFYGWVAAQAGFPALLEGVMGYGISGLSCPWWPTGAGLVAVAGALVMGVTALAGLAALDAASTRGRVPLILFAIGIPASLAALWFFAYLYGEGPGPLAIARQIANFSNAMLVALWISLGWLLLRVWQATAGGNGIALRDPALQAELLLFAVTVAPSVRSLFTKNSVNSIPMAAIASYPLLCVSALVVARGVLAYCENPEIQRRRITRATLAILIMALLYSVARVAGFVRLFDPWPPVALQTRAGTMYVNNADAELYGKLYPYLEGRVKEGEFLAELGYGGGWTFALHSRSPLFLTQTFLFAPSESRLAQEKRRLEISPPRAVVAPDTPDGRWALWGIPGNFGCTFPRVAWRTDVPSDRPEIAFPAIDYLRQKYVPVMRVPGRAVVLEPAGAM